MEAVNIHNYIGYTSDIVQKNASANLNICDNKR